MSYKPAPSTVYTTTPTIAATGGVYEGSYFCHFVQTSELSSPYLYFFLGPGAVYLSTYSYSVHSYSS